ncbi:MAG TPA: sulfotransferase [Steroidobacteraceae bacterium]|nr:sulfotransferase [Steroidobacteraceae bacterium]
MSANKARKRRAVAARLYGAGQYRDALKAASAGLRLHPGDAGLWNVGAAAAFALGLVEDAERFWKAAIANEPDFAEAYYNLGVLSSERRNFETAVALYTRAVTLAPRYVAALNNLGNALKELDRLSEAEAALRRAVTLEPTRAEACNNLAQVLLKLERFDEARPWLDRALSLNPQLAEALLTRGRLHLEAGEQAPAIKCFEAAIAVRPDYGAAYESRAAASRAEPGAPWISGLESLWSRRAQLEPHTASTLNFAMGKTREDLGEYDAAFAAYAEANRLRYARQPFDEAAEDRWLGASIAAFPREAYAEAQALPADVDRLPVFVVGMPRSGTTLVEQVLASHPEVFGAGELGVLRDLVAREPLVLPPSADRPAWRARLRILGQRYCASVWGSGVTQRCVIDKMPGNYRYLGFLALMLPEARIISVRRDPLDTCFSCYATSFADGHEYTHDLAVLARQYLRYQRLMGHWAAVLPPGRVLEVSYEALVADLEGEARRMLAFLGLPWSEQCLKFHRTARAVRTASVVQVRQPLYTRSIARWKRFERHLAPLQELLAPLAAAPATAAAAAPVG